jgi:hypothetical protein
LGLIFARLSPNGWTPSGKDSSAAKRRIMTDSETMKIEQLTIVVRLRSDSIELFSVPLPRFQQVFICRDAISVRVLENPLEESLRDYVAWGTLRNK